VCARLKGPFKADCGSTSVGPRSCVGLGRFAVMSQSKLGRRDRGMARGYRLSYARTLDGAGSTGKLESSAAGEEAWGEV